MNFDRDMLFGAATASYQIEGAAFDDAKGLSVWDKFCETPGNIEDGSSGKIACNHYYRYREDVELMSELGLQAYRFSVSWPRVIPNGIGTVNEKGLDFYDKLVDELLAKNLQPWATLFHWDYPYELYCRGGWLNPESPKWFADYTQVIINKLSDRVTNWMTLNEPQCFVGLGHQIGEHAPGLQLPISEILRINHNVLLAHGLAVQLIRANAKKTPSVGAAPVGIINIPASNSLSDIDAARQATFAVTKKDCWNNTMLADPMFFGRYPEDGLELFGSDMPRYTDNEMKTIAQPLDFYGANIYHGTITKSDGQGGIEIPDVPAGYPRTAMDWLITPEALYWGPKFLYERYGAPIVVTENGMANLDRVALDGKVHDPQRIDFVQRYLNELSRAKDDGVAVKAYFYWSLMDNFEWAFGYKKRFGLIYVDYATSERIPKDSARWYAGLIGNHMSNKS